MQATLRQHGIMRFFGLCMAVMAVAVIGSAAWQLRQAIRLHQAAETAGEVVRLAAEILELQEKLAFERVPVLNALVDAAAASDAIFADIAVQQAAVNEVAARLLRQAAADPDQRDSLRATILAVLNERGAMNARAKAQLQLPRNLRDPAVLPAYLKMFEQLLARLTPHVDYAVATGLGQQAALVSLLDLARAAWAVRATGGQRIAAVIGAISGGQSLAPEIVLRVSVLSALQGQNWRQIQILLDRLQHYPALRALAGERQGQSERGDALFADAIAASQSGRAYPLGFPAFGLQAVAPLKAVLDVRDAALAAAREEVAALRTAGRLRLGASAAILLATSALVLLVARLLRRRLVAPLAEMTEVIIRVAQGDLAAPVPRPPRRDEIGDMAEALETLRHNAITARAVQASRDEERAGREARMARLELLVQGFEAQADRLLGEVSQAGETLNATSHAMVETTERTRGQSGSVATLAREAEATVLAGGDAGHVLAHLREIGGILADIHQGVVESKEASGEVLIAAIDVGLRAAELSEEVAGFVAEVRALAERAPVVWEGAKPPGN